MSTPSDDWKLFQGDNRAPHDGIDRLPDAPPWRPFGRDPNPGVSRRKRRGETFQAKPEETDMVNAALYLRRPLLITGKPGTGKSSLAYAVAHELKLGEVLYWPITTRTTLKDGLYTYDAIGRLQEVRQAEISRQARHDGETLDTDTPNPQEKPPGDDRQGYDRPYTENPQTIADYITLGPLGTALLGSSRPRVLVIDEIDKSDIDLPNDLLTIFEEGRFTIPELLRLEQDPSDSDDQPDPISVRVRTAYTDDTEPTYSERKATITGGCITCQEFPLVILTSNGERDFPPAFLRRCLRLNMREPDKAQLTRIIQAHLDQCDLSDEQVTQLIQAFIQRRDQGKEQLATDQLLNALFMILRQREWVGNEKEGLLDHLLAPLDRPLAVKPRDQSHQSPGSERP